MSKESVLIPEEWEPGKILIGNYIVRGVLGRGGMGTVYLVENRHGDPEKYAVKTLHSKDLDSPENHCLFLEELRNWIDLPDHPNITACRFFRTVEDRLAIFAEVVSGGSLREWIEARKLTEPGVIIDVAIQMARGLQAVHDRNLIHQDIKSANILMTRDGIAKITDFGLARARQASDSTATTATDSENHLVSSSGMTLAYCSPEQAANLKLNHKTDMWSYGLSVLEMYNGGVTWMLGVAAETILKDYPGRADEIGLPIMPDAIRDMLARCFRLNPGERWSGMAEIADILEESYGQVTGKPYFRESPRRIRLKTEEAARKSVRGFIWDDPEIWLRRALDICGKNPDDALKMIPRRSGSHRAQSLIDLEVYEMTRRFLESKRYENIEDYCRIMMHTGNLMEHIGDLYGSMGSWTRSINLMREMIEKSGSDTFYDQLIIHLGARGIIHHFLQNDSAAVTDYSEALSYYEKYMLLNSSDTSVSEEVARICANKALSLELIGEMDEAKNFYIQGIRITEGMIDSCTASPEQTNIRLGLARMCINYAAMVKRMGNLSAAIESNDRAVTHLSACDQDRHNPVFLKELALAFMNKGNCLRESGDRVGAMDLYNEAIQIREQLLFDRQIKDVADDLATVYMNKGNILKELGRVPEAIKLYDQAVQIREDLVYKEGQTDRIHVLCWLYMNRATALSEIQQYHEALRYCDRTEETVAKLIADDGKLLYHFQMALLTRHKAMVLSHLNRMDNACDTIERSVTIFRDLIDDKKQIHFRGELGEALLIQARILKKIKSPHADEILESAISILKTELARTGRSDLKTALDAAEALRDQQTG